MLRESEVKFLLLKGDMSAHYLLGQEGAKFKLEFDIITSSVHDMKTVSNLIARNSQTYSRFFEFNFNFNLT